MFEKSLTDLIRGIRANKKNQEEYIATALDEIRQEVIKPDMAIKANAVSKLALLHMMGYDMTWASFHVIQVMSSTSRSQKRIGYYAAAVSFHPEIDVIMLCTNLIRKDLASNDQRDGAIAMHTLAQIVTPELARDLHTDVITALNHSKAYMRKRAILVLYRIFLKYPEAIRIGFPRLKEKLDDDDPSVVSAAVNVLCELARKNPKSYLPLAPQLYGLLTRVSSNWMIIKIVKLFASMTLLEPRLVRKLLPPLVNLIQTTTAMSVMYECVQTIITGGMIPSESELDGQPDQIAELCLNKLQILIQDSDQNLKYLGLQALGKLLPLRPNAVAEYRDVILECLRDHDSSIRLRALDLICSLSNPNNLFSIVKRLMLHLQHAQKLPTIFDSAYRNRVVSAILNICCQDTYANVPDFEWYITVLLELVHYPGVSVGSAIAEQLIDICVRVKDVEEFLVSSMAMLLQEATFLETATHDANSADVLYAVAWICGEYVSSVADVPKTMKAFMQPQLKKLPSRIQAVFIHNLYKMFVYWISTNASKETSPKKSEPQDEESPTPEAMIFVGNALLHFLSEFRHNSDLEVQDRASMVYELISRLIQDLSKSDSKPTNEDEPSKIAFPWLSIQAGFFKPEFNPVSRKAQRRVPVPEGLALDEWIFEPEPEKPSPTIQGRTKGASWTNGSLDKLFGDNDEEEAKGTYQEDPEEMERRRQERLARIKNDPFYLPMDINSKSKAQDDDKTTSPATKKQQKKKQIDGSIIGDVEDLAIQHLAIAESEKPKEQQRSRSKSPMRPPQKKKYQMRREEDVIEPSASSLSPEKKIHQKAFHEYTAEELEELRVRDPDTYAVLSVDISSLLIEEQERQRANEQKLQSRGQIGQVSSITIDAESVSRRKKYQDLSSIQIPKLRKKKANGDLKSPVLENNQLSIDPLDLDENGKKAKKKKKKKDDSDKAEKAEGGESKKKHKSKKDKKDKKKKDSKSEDI